MTISPSVSLSSRSIDSTVSSSESIGGTDADNNQTDSSGGNGALVGGIVGGLFGVLLLIAICLCVLWVVRRRRQRGQQLVEHGGDVAVSPLDDDADVPLQQKPKPVVLYSRDPTVSESRHGETMRAPPEPDDEEGTNDDEYELVVRIAN
jgi:hypothetical protein